MDWVDQNGELPSMLINASPIGFFPSSRGFKKRGPSVSLFICAWHGDFLSSDKQGSFWGVVCLPGYRMRGRGGEESHVMHLSLQTISFFSSLGLSGSNGIP